MTLSTLPLNPAVGLAAASVPRPRPSPIQTTAGRSPDIDGLIRRTNDLLAAGVPLTLLMDLTDPAGPHSQDLFTHETSDLDWLQV